jgi:predicted acylesterase/phospholipase RssA
MAALVAAGYSAAELTRLGSTLRRRDFLQYAWPERRIVANWVRRRVRRRPPGWWSVAPCRRTVGRLLGGARFRDLPRPCFIQATDLTHGRPVCFGPASHPNLEVALAVSASMALPALMAPVDWDGRTLADGGAFVHLTGLPIAADRVVVSDVSTHGAGPAGITSLGRALCAYLRAREHGARPPRRVGGRPVTVLPYASLVDRLPAFRRPHPAVVHQVIAEACAVALQALSRPGRERSPHA